MDTCYNIMKSELNAQNVLVCSVWYSGSAILFD